jgi:L-threonylcarbamoyladenylate synthase
VTRRLSIDPDRPSGEVLGTAVEWLRSGGVVAYPTDTLYGLAVDPTSASAVDALYAVKGRPAASAIPLLAASLEQVEEWFGGLHGSTAILARAFWPGPLSLILDAPPTLAPAVHAGTFTVAVRVPAHTLARTFAQACGHPITSTSANLSGAPAVASPSALGAVADDARVVVIDAGQTPGGPPSTIVDARGDRLTLVRDGAIAWNRVLKSVH